MSEEYIPVDDYLEPIFESDEECAQAKVRYDELATKYYSDVPMTSPELAEFVALRDIFEPEE